jgi:hypothetical protein
MPDLISVNPVTDVYPVTDVALWLRFLVGTAGILWLPGFLAAGRHLHRRPLPTRIVVSLGLGFILLPLWAQGSSLFGVGVRPLQYLPPVLILSALFGTTSISQRLGEALDSRSAAPPALGACLLGSSLIVFACIALGFADFVVPPSTHDAANHAFMTLRISQAGTILASEVFGAPYGHPDLPYAMGLHSTASMIAQTTGLASYVAVWLLALTFITLLPISLSILWDEWHLPAATIALAALFVAANPYVPARMLWWGLFGTAAGFFLVPICALLLERFWSEASVELGIAAGMAVGSLMLIHGSEVPTAGLAALTTILLHRRPPRLMPKGWIAFVVTGVLCGGYFLAGVAPAYLSGGIENGQEFIETLSMTADQSLGAIGAEPGLRIVGALALLFGLTQRKTRVIAIFALGLLGVVTALGLWRDPFSELLTTPFYRQPERTRYLFIFFAPALMGAALFWIWERIRAKRWPLAPRAIVATLVLGALIAPELPGIVRGFETKIEFSPFSSDDFAQALQIAETVEPDEWIVNQFFDGSSWVMHLSGRRFLVPTGWRTTPPGALPNQQTLQRLLRGMSFDLLDSHYRFLYVSDLRTGRPRGFTRQRVDADPRFDPVLVGKDSTLYRIRRRTPR